MEPAIANPDNPVALAEHLLCLLYEAAKAPSCSSNDDGRNEAATAGGIVREDGASHSLSFSFVTCRLVKREQTQIHAHAMHTAELIASFGSDAAAVRAALDHLAAQGSIARVGSTLQLRDRAALSRRPPASRVNIRSISSDAFKMVLAGSGGDRVLETVEADKAFYQVNDACWRLGCAVVAQPMWRPYMDRRCSCPL